MKSEREFSGTLLGFDDFVSQFFHILHGDHRNMERNGALITGVSYRHGARGRDGIVRARSMFAPMAYVLTTPVPFHKPYPTLQREYR